MTENEEPKVQKKAFDEFDMTCSHCGKPNHVVRHRKRLNPVEPPDYEFTMEVEPLLPGTGEPEEVP